MDAPHTLDREEWVPRPIEEVFAFFADTKNLETLTPPWMRFHILTPQPVRMFPGAEIDYRLRWHGLPLRWKTEIVCWEPPRRFEDLQRKGPYRLWHHTHRFEAVSGGTRILDHVEYRLPFGIFGEMAHALSVRRNLQEIFAYRQTKIRQIFGDEPQSEAGRK